MKNKKISAFFLIYNGAQWWPKLWPNTWCQNFQFCAWTILLNQIEKMLSQIVTNVQIT